jgi:putative tryptophan/tyrosine transport system substrate-binding protein
VVSKTLKKIKNMKIFCLTLCIVLFALCGFADAQQPAKIPKIGFLSSGIGADGSSGWHSRFVREFGKLGYVEGKNIAFEFRNADTNYDQLPALAEELIRSKVDVIVTPGSNDTRAAKNATKSIPIVFTGAGSDPVTLGLVDNLARPGGNVTGFAQINSLLAGKRLELLKETVPKLSRVAVLWDPQNAGSKEIWEESQRQAKKLGLQPHSLKINRAAELESSFKDAIKAGSDALAGTSGALLGSIQKQTISLAAKHRLPSIFARQSWVENGGLLSYGPDDVEPYRRAALMVDKILKGARPADLPVEQPTKFELTINLKTAKQIGVTIPQAVLYRADRVIK